MSQLESSLGDWYPLFQKTVESYPKEYSMLKHVLKVERASRTIYPGGSEVFKAFELCQLKDTKVIIIGQDPYHNGAATGLICF